MNENALRNFSGVARLFPLPNLVLFPGVVQGLHIFEPRYRQMTADALAGDKLIALATLRADEVDSPRPGVEPYLCLGDIIWHQELPDGKYNLRLRGLTRAKIVQELDSDRMYRTARIELIREVAPTDLALLSRLRRELAAVLLSRFADVPETHQQLQDLFASESPLGEVCDVLSFALPLPTELKLALIAEEHTDRRAIALADAITLSVTRSDRPFPPPFSAN